MAIDVTIIVGTFGDPSWAARGHDTAMAAAQAAPTAVIAVHGDTLAQARNAGASTADTEWLCFLDAGDELAPGYLPAMGRATADLRAPELRLIHPDGRVEVPYLIGRNILTINPCPIGTLIRRDLFWAVGGFWEERAWEDWSLFRRCALLGATIGHVLDAVYLAPVDPSGRNSTVVDPSGLHRSITDSHAAWVQGLAA